MATIGELEKQAGITDRAAFWAQFAPIKGSVKIGHKLRDASFEAGVTELRRLVAARPAA